MKKIRTDIDVISIKTRTQISIFLRIGVLFQGFGVLCLFQTRETFRWACFVGLVINLSTGPNLLLETAYFFTVKSELV